MPRTDGKPGYTREKAARIKIGKGRKVAEVKEIKPSIGVLTDNNDSGGRTISDHRAMVERYASQYDSRKEIFTGEALTDENEFKGCDKVRNDDPWRGNRYAVESDKEGIALLAMAFKAMHSEDMD